MKARLTALIIFALLFAGCGETASSALPLPSPTPELLLLPSPVPEAPSETSAPSATPIPTPAPEKYPEIEISYLDSELVRISDFSSEMAIDLRYASTENFTAKVIYDFTDAYIRYGTLQKLISVQQTLSTQGYKLLIWDAYRPQQAQFALWEVVPNANFVANPYTGHSSHSNGGTLDLSLLYADGSSVEMPSDFDEFDSSADRDYSDVSAQAGENALILQNAMQAAGFIGYRLEWWHYSDSTAYPYEDLESLTLPAVYSQFYIADCNEYINLRLAPDYSAESLAQIPAGEEMKLLAWCGGFAHVQYGSLHGYVAADYIKPVITEE